MPLYDFACRECNEPFESLVRKESEIATVTCPKCSSPKVDRQLSLPAAPISATQTSLPSACGSGPPCGAPCCQRQG
jgi:putative FmdB family regulatory protein